MTTRRLLPLALVAAWCGAAHAQPDPFLAGNSAAAAGDHVAAAAAFETAIVTRGWSPSTLLGLGNAYAGAGKPGRAILAYERAHLLAPRDRAIAANLAHVRDSAGVSVPNPSRVASAIATLTADEWTRIALGGGALACAGVIGLAWSVRRRGSRTLAVTGALVAGIAGVAASYTAPSADLAVVVTGDVARIAPFAAAEAAFTAPEGETVQIEQQRGDYVYVRDGDRTGWLPRTALERVVSPIDAPADHERSTHA
jgi:hypothetical protein